MRRLARAVLLAALAAPAGLAGRSASADGGAASAVEKEFAAAIKTVTPATVFIVAKGVPAGIESGSSGVIVTKSGYVLTDGDPGVYTVGPRRAETDDVEVRIPDLKRATFQVFPAKVVRRVRDIDSALVKITTPPSSGFSFVLPRTADDLRVGAFTFAMGTPFGHGEGGTAALTAGVVSALVRAPEGAPGGKFLEVYTSAAVNPGVNGGPLVDADGALVGIISTWGQPEPKNPFQFLGKAHPIDRIRAAYKDLPDAAQIFPDPKTLPPRSKQSALLEIAFGLAAAKAYPSVVSLEVAPSPGFEVRIQLGANQFVKYPRYEGPVSGVVVSKDGWIVTSLYNLADIRSLVGGDASADIEGTLSKITGVTAHFSDGVSAPARLVAHDQRLGIACLKADLPEGKESVPADAAPPEAAQVGRMVLSVGNPFGAARSPDPLVTVGIYSRFHSPESDDPWRGDFQTDAAITDADCGGALVDVRGRILGLAMLWNPVQQGRSSGIGFGVPWDRVLAALPALEAGTTIRAGFLGVKWQPEAAGGVRIVNVDPKSPAEAAGLKPGDVVTAIDGHPVRAFSDAVRALRRRSVGEKVKITVKREGASLDLEATLASRPPGS